ncbi:hypothetical protein SAE02_76360 [Skermanella aerolata]|uniref:Uncharacterized protein n=1 Tax=Skermanella aerolata TaxID=393310 RepID=A0A512E437_9PROT|nr:hypothetical protein SAE02_76360 [Skermanella aerolata]
MPDRLRREVARCRLCRPGGDGAGTAGVEIVIGGMARAPPAVAGLIHPPCCRQNNTAILQFDIQKQGNYKWFS